MVTAPTTLTNEALFSSEPMYPAYVDKLRVVVQKKLGWGPLEARAFFEPFKKRSRAGTLSVGELLRAVQLAHGNDAALTVYRAIWWFANEGLLKRSHRKPKK